MIPTFKTPFNYGDKVGHLQSGWASWDGGEMTDRSIKWAYKDSSGKISRGAPELPPEVLTAMVLFAHKQGELSHEDVAKLRAAFA